MASVVEAADDLLVRARARVGTVLKDKYRLDRVLGVGGMAAVYQATHLRNASKVAIKILHREVSLDRDLRARFLREGLAGNVIEHPGAIRVLDDDVAEDGSAFLVMELLDGETVDARWERSGRRLRIGEVVSIAIDLLDVLAAAHAKGIVHRDVKPENLFLASDGRLKCLDFGIARLGPSSPTKTKSGAIFGTPAFLAPEQALGRVREVDALSDVFAVGATAFSLLTGRFVHEGETGEEMVVRAATTPPPSLSSLLLSVPGPIASVIDRALSFDRSARWQSATEMREALVHARDETILATADDWGDGEERTKLAPPPKMTLPPSVLGSGQPTVPTPTIPSTSTVGGLSSNSDRRHGPWLLVAVLAAMLRAFARVGPPLRDLSRRAITRLGVLTGSDTLTHRRRQLWAGGAGLLVALVGGVFLLVVARSGRSETPSMAPAASPVSNVAAAVPTPTETKPAPPPVASEAPVPATDTTTPATVSAAPPDSHALRPPRPSPRPKPTVRHDPLAP